MKFPGRKRGVAALGVLATIVGLMLWVVLPALATTPGQPVPPQSTGGVTPTDYGTGGQSNDCALFEGSSTTLNQYRIANPKSQTYSTKVNGATVTFTLTLNPSDAQHSPAYASNKYVDVSSTGAAIVDIGIKGGTDETRYNYGPGYVAADGALHAPAQSVYANGDPSQLYSISNMTFCFNVLGSVSGTVYQDANQNGANDVGDSPLSGWTVRLYKGVTAGTAGGGSVVATTTSTPTGSYSFGILLDPASTYRVCEAPPSSSGTWAQTQPLPGSPNLCTGTNELSKAYDGIVPASATQNIAGLDFGNVPSQCDPLPLGIPGLYEIHLAGGGCKNNTFVFDHGTTPSGSPYVSVWAADQTLPKVPMVEKMTFADPIVNGQPTYTKILYTDTFPFAKSNLPTMQYCKLDPRDGSEFGLNASYETYAQRAGVLPGSETSCVISITTSVDASGHGQLLAYVYSSIDGLRTTG